MCPLSSFEGYSRVHSVCPLLGGLSTFKVSFIGTSIHKTPQDACTHKITLVHGNFFSVVLNLKLMLLVLQL